MEETQKMLPKIWQEFLAKKPETGMGYQIVSLQLKDGRKIEDVAIIQCSLIAEIRTQATINFNPEEIQEIELTHRKRNFSKK
jgi:hypothetical protein